MGMFWRPVVSIEEKKIERIEWKKTGGGLEGALETARWGVQAEELCAHCVPLSAWVSIGYVPQYVPP